MRATLGAVVGGLLVLSLGCEPDQAEDPRTHIRYFCLSEWKTGKQQQLCRKAQNLAHTEIGELVVAELYKVADGGSEVVTGAVDACYLKAMRHHAVDSVRAAECLREEHGFSTDLTNEQEAVKRRWERESVARALCKPDSWSAQELKDFAKCMEEQTQ